MNGISKRRAIVYLAAIFLAGVVTGGVTGFTVGRRSIFRPPPQPREMAPRILEGLKKDLSLTDEQVRQIQPLLQRHCSELGALHSGTRERMAEMIRKSHEEIGQFLTPEQRDKLAALDREREAFFRQKGHGSPPPPRR
jgi:Spy/CpxP family protein refolding chaperone